jgi:hypothetical protein
MIGKPYTGKPYVRFDEAGDGKVLWRTYTGTKLETVDTAKAIPTVTRHSLTLPTISFSTQTIDIMMLSAFLRRAGPDATYTTYFYSTLVKISFPAWHVGQSQSSGKSSKAVSGPMFCVWSPSSGS